MRSLSGMKMSAAISTPAKIARPPSSGVASLRQAARLHLVDGADAAREAGHERRQGGGRGERDEGGVERVELHSAAEDRRAGGAQGSSDSTANRG